MGRSNRVARIGLTKAVKQQLKIKKQTKPVVEKKVKKPKSDDVTKKPVEEKKPASKYVTEGMTDYCTLMRKLK